jgi:hypothetical protein
MSVTRLAIRAVSSIPCIGTASSRLTTYLQTGCAEYIVNGWHHKCYQSYGVARHYLGTVRGMKNPSATR